MCVRQRKRGEEVETEIKRGKWREAGRERTETDIIEKDSGERRRETDVERYREMEREALKYTESRREKH